MAGLAVFGRGGPWNGVQRVLCDDEPPPRIKYAKAPAIDWFSTTGLNEPLDYEYGFYRLEWYKAEALAVAGWRAVYVHEG